MIMPPAKYFRQEQVDHKKVVASVFKCRPEIKSNRAGIMKTPSVIRAEFTREREKLEEFRQKMRKNIQDEKTRQRQRFEKMKAKYDKEGVQVVENESEIGTDQTKQ